MIYTVVKMTPVFLFGRYEKRRNKSTIGIVGVNEDGEPFRIEEFPIDKLCADTEKDKEKLSILKKEQE